MGRFALLTLLFVLWFLPPFTGGGDLIALEVVGGVEAAPEPEGSGERDGKNSEEERQPLSVGDSILKDLELDPRGEGYERKTASLFLDQVHLEKVMEQISDLDAEDFRKRNEASKALVMVAAPIEHLLGAARRDAGAEMSRRIQGILNVRIKRRRLDALYHVAGRLAAEETPGWGVRLGVMASTFDPVSHWDLLRMFEIAAAKCSRQQDREVFDKALGADHESQRGLAAFVIGYRFSGDAKASGVADAIGDNEVLKLALARGRAAAGESQAATVLLELLVSENVRVRHESAMLLRGLFGRDFGFAGYDPPERQAKAIARWQNFLGSLGQDGEVVPMQLGSGARGEFMVLVGTPPGKEGAVIPWTTSGRKVKDLKLAASMAAIRPDAISFDDAAGLVVASGGGYEEGRVAVFTNDGTEIWSASGIPVGGGTAIMPGGRLLVAIGREVEELDVSGNRVGVWKMPSRVLSFKRLREGRFLCAHPEDGSLAEYGRGGELLWKAGGFNHPSWVDRLQSGNLLVVVHADKPKEGAGRKAGAGKIRVIETSPDGKVVLSSIQPKGVNVISSVARLPNGNTLVGTEKGLAEYTPEGYAVKVWLKSVISSIHVR
jgi:hypothetical protein